MTNFQFVAVSFKGYRSGPSARLIVQVLLSLLFRAGALFRSRNGMKPASSFLISKHTSIWTISFTEFQFLNSLYHCCENAFYFKVRITANQCWCPQELVRGFLRRPTLPHQTCNRLSYQSSWNQKNFHIGEVIAVLYAIRTSFQCQLESGALNSPTSTRRHVTPPVKRQIREESRCLHSQ